MIFENQIAALERLPVELAIRLVLDDIAYSNALPNWFDAISIDYSNREAIIRQKLRVYLGGSNPQPSFGVLVPKKSGKKKTWTIPSVNDQITLQACIASFAERLDTESLDDRVFSYRYNRQPDRLALIEDQIAAWTRFQDETKLHCANSDCILQIDLKDAFQSIDRRRFYDFLSNFTIAPVLEVLKRLLDSFALESGLPLLNNSVFFLGNAYFSQVDKIVQTHAPKFIRYVDDYRIFGESKKSLEISLQRIAIDLERAEFHINSDKLKVGEGLEYLDAVSKVQYGVEIGDNGYVSPAVVRDLMRGEDIASTISTSINDPERYLNEGFGRFQLAVIRKYRFNRDIASIIKPGEQSSTLADALSGDLRLIRKFCELLRTYSRDPHEIWRTVWLLYVAKDFDFARIADRDMETAAQLQAALEDIRSSSSWPPVTRLWADKNAGTLAPGEDVNTLHDLSYVESGQRYCRGCNNENR